MDVVSKPRIVTTMADVEGTERSVLVERRLYAHATQLWAQRIIALVGPQQDGQHPLEVAYDRLLQAEASQGSPDA
jgi:hypothetical protein